MISMAENEFSSSAHNRFLAEKKLMGAKCKRCGAISLPLRPICPKCNASEMELVEMNGRGKLVAYTVISVGPPMMIEEGFDREHPYCSGIVELEEGVRIPGRIVGVNVAEPDQIKMGTPVTVEYQERVHGEEKRTFLAFRAL
jgi:uncharacterized OB-fold protein